MKKTIAIAMTAALLATTPALAGDFTPALNTMGYVSMDMESQVDLDFHMPIGDDADVFGFVPELQGQFGFGNGAVGLNLGLAVAVPDQGDTGYWIGNFSVFGKGGFCTSGPLELCFGGQLEVSLAPLKIDDEGEAAAFAMGTLAYLRYDRFGTEMLTVSPAVAASLKVSILWAQAHLGTDIFFPYSCDECDTAEAALTFGVAGGVVLMDMIALGVGFRVFDIISEDHTDAQGVMDLIVKASLGPVEPSVVLTVYLDDETNDFLPVGISAGVSAVF